MSWFRSLFGRSQTPPEHEEGLEEHLDYLRSLTAPAIGVSASATEGLSRIGGLPALTEDVAWPESNGKPLAFLSQLALSEIPGALDRRGLPLTGMLYFFYEQEQETWGFDPKDSGSWRVLYSAAENGAPRAAPDGLAEDCIYAEKRVGFTSVETYPPWEDERIEALDLSDRRMDQYMDDLCSGVFGGQPTHHLFGYPSVIQDNDMDLQCQLVSNGLYCGDQSGYEDPRAKELEAGRRDWTLLLELDSDDNAGMMWGDCGRLYFWIRNEDLQNRSFDRCWMVLQCY